MGYDGVRDEFDYLTFFNPTPSHYMNLFSCCQFLSIYKLFFEDHSLPPFFETLTSFMVQAVPIAWSSVHCMGLRLWFGASPALCCLKLAGCWDLWAQVWFGSTACASSAEYCVGVESTATITHHEGWRIEAENKVGDKLLLVVVLMLCTWLYLLPW